MKFEIFLSKEKIDNSRYVLRDLELDVSRHRVSVCNSEVHLRNKEFALLHFMMLNKGRVLSRTDILENVWDRNANMMTNTVDVHISTLRKKIEKVSKRRFIHTIPCLGYILE
jgi:two-component system copper resistance phosphate regulon response regulator CusR